jgi:hypothetical protein
MVETDGTDGEAFVANNQGQLVATLKLTDVAYIYPISLLTSGIYMIHITNAITTKTFKVIE